MNKKYLPILVVGFIIISGFATFAITFFLKNEGISNSLLGLDGGNELGSKPISIKIIPIDGNDLKRIQEKPSGLKKLEGQEYEVYIKYLVLNDEFVLYSWNSGQGCIPIEACPESYINNLIYDIKNKLYYRYGLGTKNEDILPFINISRSMNKLRYLSLPNERQQTKIEFLAIQNGGAISIPYQFISDPVNYVPNGSNATIGSGNMDYQYIQETPFPWIDGNGVKQNEILYTLRQNTFSSLVKDLKKLDKDSLKNQIDSFNNNFGNNEVMRDVLFVKKCNNNDLVLQIYQIDDNLNINNKDTLFTYKNGCPKYFDE